MKTLTLDDYVLIAEALSTTVSLIDDNIAWGNIYDDEVADEVKKAERMDALATYFTELSKG